MLLSVTTPLADIDKIYSYLQSLELAFLNTPILVKLLLANIIIFSLFTWYFRVNSPDIILSCRLTKVGRYK